MKTFERLQPIPTRRLKNIKDVLFSKLGTIKEGLNIDELTYSISGNQLVIGVKDEFANKYTHFPVTYTFTQPEIVDLFRTMGFADEYSQFDLPRLNKYLQEQGFEYVHDDEGNQLLLDTHVDNIDIESTNTKQTLAYTHNDGTFELPLVERKASALDILNLITPTKDFYVMMDVARKYARVDDIIKCMQVAKENKATHFMLHISDNEAFRLNLGGICDIRDVFHKIVYNEEQCAQIENAAKELGLTLVLDIGVPAHMGAIYNRLSDEVKSTHFDDNKQLRYTETATRDWLVSLYTHVLTNLFPNTTHLHLGGDEFTFDVNYAHEHAEFFNCLSNSLNTNVRPLQYSIWNDGITKNTLSSFTDYTVLYWSYTDRQENPETVTTLLEHKATVDDLIEHGYNVINANSRYTYAVPKPSLSSQNHDFDARSTLLNYSPAKWDGENMDRRYYPISAFKGGFFGIWGEHISEEMPYGTIIEYVRDHMAVCSLITQAINDLDRETYIDSLTRNDFQGFINRCCICTDPEVSNATNTEVDVELVFDYRWGALREVHILNEYQYHDGWTLPPIYVMGNNRTTLKLDYEWIKQDGVYWKDGLSYHQYESSQSNTYIYVGDEVVIEYTGLHPNQ